MGLLFANGGAKKNKTKKKKSKQKASTLTGQLRSPVDVRSQTSIGAFEDLLDHGPITIILIYADWCGACTRFKENTWNDIVTMPPNQRTVNIASVREDMLPLTSVADAKIDGYPSLILVGKDKKPAEFINESGQATNALPNNEKENIMKILTTPVPKSITNLSVASNVKEIRNRTPNNVIVNTVNLQVTPPKQRNSKNLLTGMNTSPVINESPLPPNMTADLSDSLNDAEVRSKQMGGSCSACQMPPLGQMGGARTMKRKGGLFSALSSIAEKGLPAAILVGLASKKRQKKTKKHRK